jgi:4-amino-4-deoxy-L-arabinose transferase-like glycosyltransferase
VSARATAIPDSLSLRAWTLIVLGLALLVRAPLLGTITASSDTSQYLATADDLWAGRGFESAAQYRTPGYPLFLALVKLLPGSTLGAASTVQHLCGAVLAATLVALGWRWFGRLVGVLSGLLAASSPLLASLEQQLTPDFLFCVTCFAATAILIELGRRDRLGPWTSAGVGTICGVCALIKPGGQFLLVVPLGAMLLAKVGWRRAWRLGLCAAAGAAVAVSPWVIRNVVRFDNPALSVQGGQSLWLRAFDAGRMRIPTDTADGRFTKRVYDRTYAGSAPRDGFPWCCTRERASYSRVAQELIARRGYSEREVYDLMGDLSKQAIKRQPGRYVWSTGVMSGLFLASVGVPEQPSPRRLLDLARPRPLRFLTLAIWGVAVPLTNIWWLVSLGTLAGFVLALRGRAAVRWPAAVLATTWLAVVVSTALVNHYEHRFALQVGPQAWLLGSAGAVALVGRLRTRPHPGAH